MTIQSGSLSLAGEYAVASELCRRNIYTQLTLGNLKRTDLLIFSEDSNRLLRVEVKSKQGGSWPNCRGVYGDNVVLVLVDFAGKSELERPDFYILTVEDWIDFVKRGIETEKAKKSDTVIEIDDKNVPIWKNQIDSRGQPYKGMGVTPKQIQEHKERWDKIVQAIGHID